jgi:anaerobic selenocysteine-containing dehydrogenase
MSEIRRSYCGLCHPRCGTLLHLEGDRVTKVSGDPDHPVNRGLICERGRLMPDHLYHPERLNFPLKRKAGKGQGQWQQLTWEQALDEIARKLADLRDRWGAETLAFTHGTKRTYHWDQRRFFNLFGSPNTCGANNICYCPSYATDYATYGGAVWSELKGSNCIVIWGKGASNSDPTGTYVSLVRAQKRGAKLIVIDPRRTKEAQMADIWLQIRPGTDVALMLAWIRLIIQEELYDRDFVENWTVGFDKLVTAVDPYTPERVAGITTLDRDQITAAARLYATVKPAAIPFGFGLDKQGVNATQCARARAILRAITGNLEVPGGDLFSQAGDVGSVRGDDYLNLDSALPAQQRAKQLGADRYPFFGFPGWERALAANQQLPPGYVAPPSSDVSCIAFAPAVFDAVIKQEPYPVTAMITLANNPLLAFPNPKHIFEALQALALYVVMDYYLTPSAALADYVLPACSTVERPELWLSDSFCMACPAGVAPLFERRNSYDLYRGLGLRLGQGEHWPWETVEAVYDHCLEPVGLTFAELTAQYGFFGQREYRRYETLGFGTPSGKVELYASIFEALDLEPLPLYREPRLSPQGDRGLAAEYPLIMITGSRFMPMYHSEQRQIQKARKKMSEPLVAIHPETAADLGLSQHQMCLVSSPHGKIQMRVEITDTIHPTMVDVQHGWWFPERSPTLPELFGVFESNANLLCPDDPEFCSPEIGSWPHSALLCRIDKLP